jgi:phosphate transport system substrate-binding protein
MGTESDGGDRWPRLIRALPAILALVLAGCAPAVEPPAPVHLKVAGSTSMRALTEELAEAYISGRDWVSIDVDPRGTELGLEALREGSADIALVSRELRPSEGRGLEATAVAYDAIAVIVNDLNGVNDLTTAELRGIYSGRILVWEELGGEEADIQVLSREDGSGTREAFEGLVMEGEQVTTMAVVLPGDAEIGQFVAENPLSIGYASSAAIPLGTHALRIDGATISLQSIAQGTYPLRRPFMLVVRENEVQDVRSFIDFVLSPTGQAIVGRRYGRVR